LVCVATGSIDQVTEIFDQGVIPILLGFLKSGNPMLEREVNISSREKENFFRL